MHTCTKTPPKPPHTHRPRGPVDPVHGRERCRQDRDQQAPALVPGVARGTGGGRRRTGRASWTRTKGPPRQSGARSVRQCKVSHARTSHARGRAMRRTSHARTSHARTRARGASGQSALVAQRAHCTAGCPHVPVRTCPSARLLTPCRARPLVAGRRATTTRAALASLCAWA